MAFVRDSESDYVTPSFSNTYLEHRAIVLKGGEYRGDLVYLGEVEDGYAYTNISIVPACAGTVSLVKQEFMYVHNDIVYFKESPVEESHLHKFLGNSITFGCTSNGKCLPAGGDYRFCLVFDDMGGQDITIMYDVVRLKGVYQRERIVVPYLTESICEYGEHTHGMKKYTLPVSFKTHGGVSKLYAFMPWGTTSVQLFVDGIDYGCPFTKNYQLGSRPFYTFDMMRSPMRLGPGNGAKLVVHVDDGSAVGDDNQPMALVGLHENVLGFVPNAEEACAECECEW